MTASIAGRRGRKASCWTRDGWGSARAEGGGGGRDNGSRCRQQAGRRREQTQGRLVGAAATSNSSSSSGGGGGGGGGCGGGGGSNSVAATTTSSNPVPAASFTPGSGPEGIDGGAAGELAGRSSKQRSWEQEQRVRRRCARQASRVFWRGWEQEESRVRARERCSSCDAGALSLGLRYGRSGGCGGCFCGAPGRGFHVPTLLGSRQP